MTDQDRVEIGGFALLAFSLALLTVAVFHFVETPPEPPPIPAEATPDDLANEQADHGCYPGGI